MLIIFDILYVDLERYIKFKNKNKGSVKIMLSLLNKNRSFFDDFFEDFNVFNLVIIFNLMRIDIKEI